MGIFKFSLLAAIAAATAAPNAAVAQEDGASPVLQDFRLDPTRDPNRPRAPVRAGPEIGTLPDAIPLPSVSAPTVTPPPVVAATPPPVVAPTVKPAPRVTRQKPVTEPANQAPLAPEATTVPDPEKDMAAPRSDTPNGTPSAPVAAPASVPESQTTAKDMMPWIIGGIVVLLIGTLLFWRRRKRTEEPVEETNIAPLPVESKPTRPAPVDTAEPAPVPSPAPAPIVTRAHAEVPALAPLTLTFTPLQARTTMVGVQLAYRLTLRNQGKLALDGLAIPALMINADAQQPQKLAAFFDDPFAREAHRVAHIALGAEVTVEGELRLEQLVPIEVQGRALLIPLVAFKVISLDGDELARATFIIGQESNPPRVKMAPFRLDQGPRQFRDIGCRPAQDMIAA